MRNPSGIEVRLRALSARMTFGRLIDDFLVLASGQFLSKIFGFVAFAWLARTLSAENYGAIETAVGMAAIGAIALEMGTGAVGVRRLSQNEGKPTDVLGAVISGRIALAIVAAPLLAFVYGALTRTGAPTALFWLYAASLFAIPFNHNWFFQANERMGVAGFGQTLKMAIFLIALFLLAPQRNGVTYVAIAEIIGAFAMAVWFSAFAFNMTKPLRPHYDLGAGAALVRESAEIGASSFVNALAQYLPILVVASLGAAVETAEFGAAQRLFLSLMTFSYVYYFNLFPLMARRMLEDPAALRRIVDASVRVVAWAGISIAAILSALAPEIMSLIFGASFRDAGAEFGVLVWSGAIILISGNARWLLVAGKRQQSLLAAQIVNAVVTVGAAYLLAARWGGLGAAFGCIIGSLALWTVAYLRTSGLDVRPSLPANLPALAAGAVIIAALTLLNLSGPLAAAAAALVLAAGMALDRGFLPAVDALRRAKAAT